jgi:hypothetical protein
VPLHPLFLLSPLSSPLLSCPLLYSPPLPLSTCQQTRLTYLNLDSRGVTDACLPLLLPLGGCLRGLDLSGGRITTRGAAVLAGGFRALTALELCGGHITGTCTRVCVFVLCERGKRGRRGGMRFVTAATCSTGGGV